MSLKLKETKKDSHKFSFDFLEFSYVITKIDFRLMIITDALKPFLRFREDGSLYPGDSIRLDVIKLI